jgi:hypothetical protein
MQAAAIDSDIVHPLISAAMLSLQSHDAMLSLRCRRAQACLGTGQQASWAHAYPAGQCWAAALGSRAAGGQPCTGWLPREWAGRLLLATCAHCCALCWRSLSMHSLTRYSLLLQYALGLEQGFPVQACHRGWLARACFGTSSTSCEECHHLAFLSRHLRLLR